MRTITINLYRFDELSAEAKERAREWYRESILDASDFSSVIEDAARIGELFGIDFSTYGKLNRPPIYWSGFYSQGDGACFVGRYRYMKGALRAVKEEAPMDVRLHGIVMRLQGIQKNNSYQIVADVKQRGRYSHAYSTDIDVEHQDGKVLADGSEREVISCLRDFMNWIYGNLEKEYEYLCSNENIDDFFLSNEYEFTENGKAA